MLDRQGFEHLQFEHPQGAQPATPLPIIPNHGIEILPS